MSPRVQGSQPTGLRACPGGPVTATVYGMMDGKENPPASRSFPGQHLRTISHEGRFWDVYLELDDDPRRQDTARGLFAFSLAGGRGDDGLVRTAVILIEKSYEELARKARDFDDRQLEALLRSALP